MEPSAVIFDLDGTLVNSLSDIVEVVNMTRRFYGLAALPQEQVRRSIGKGVENLIQGCFPEMQAKNIPAILNTHREFYLKHPHVGGSVYPGVPETLQTLRTHGFRLGIATNKPKPVAVLTLKHYLPQIAFDAVCGPEDVSKKKPAPDHLLETLKRMGIRPENAWYCGDDPVDLACAKAAKVRFLAAGWGFGAVQGDASNHVLEFPKILTHIVPSTKS